MKTLKDLSMRRPNTHMNLLSEINDTDDARHVHAWNWRTGSGIPAPIPMMLEALARYADAHAKMYESGIGEDAVLGEEWQTAVCAVRGLLNGDCGALDCGTLDRCCVAMLTKEGFES